MSDRGSFCTQYMYGDIDFDKLKKVFDYLEENYDISIAYIGKVVVAGRIKVGYSCGELDLVRGVFVPNIQTILEEKSSLIITVICDCEEVVMFKIYKDKFDEISLTSDEE
jgi:hypothetical protein